MILRLKPMGKLATLKIQVLDRTKVLHGPQTQAYEETSYSQQEPRWSLLLFFMIMMGFE